MFGVFFGFSVLVFFVFDSATIVVLHRAVYVVYYVKSRNFLTNAKKKGLHSMHETLSV